ncbi:hypothetical protein SBOR_1778 [Sclerotinia borealis F-4128]|uniref:Uncharacterized protein n=1 Tax=Sclerotinia borealis (strain F-4128) TaxID=1432307 RepID=W9CP88_SCLBF|nr:hypothetical protein SBOR_1778 [Sclerotinia borealis F-4128]
MDPLRNKRAEQRSYGHDHWVLKKKQDCTEAVIGIQQPSKMRIGLVNTEDPSLDRELFYDRGFGEPFDWNDTSDLSLLNEWRQETFRKYTKRNMAQMKDTTVVTVTEDRGTQETRSSQGQESDGFGDQLLAMISHRKEIEAFHVQKRRSARLTTQKPVSSRSSRRQKLTNPQKIIEFPPIDFDKVASLIPEQHQRRQRVQHRYWKMTSGLIERSFDFPDREIGTVYNL